MATDCGSCRGVVTGLVSELVSSQDEHRDSTQFAVTVDPRSILLARIGTVLLRVSILALRAVAKIRGRMLLSEPGGCGAPTRTNGGDPVGDGGIGPRRQIEGPILPGHVLDRCRPISRAIRGSSGPWNKAIFNEKSWQHEWSRRVAPWRCGQKWGLWRERLQARFWALHGPIFGVLGAERRGVRRAPDRTCQRPANRGVCGQWGP